MPRSRPVRPEDSYALAGMERVDVDRSEAAVRAQIEQINVLLRQPGPCISEAAGVMERESPLFFGTGNNPTLF